MKNKTYLIILLFLLFTFNLAYSQNDTGKILELLSLGQYIQAEKALKTESESSPENSALQALINYQKPQWAVSDTSQLKKNKKQILPLISSIIKTPLPPEGTEEQIAWINRMKSRYINALAIVEPEKSESFLIGLLKSPNAVVRFEAIKALREGDYKDLARPLYEYLTTSRLASRDEIKGMVTYSKLEEQGRVLAIQAIVETNGEVLIDELLKEAEDKGSPDRITAIAILTGLRELSLKENYKKLLRDPEDKVKVFAASALIDLGDDSGIEPLEKMFKLGDQDKKLWIYRVLTQYCHKQTAEFFIEYLRESGRGAQLSYIPLIAPGRYPNMDRILNSQLKVVSGMTQTLISWKEITPSVVVKQLEKENTNFKYMLMEILAETREPEAREYFRKQLKSSDPLTVYFSIWALAELQDEESIPGIKTYLNSENPYLKSAAAWSLARMGDSSGYNLAVNKIFSQDPVLAANSLGVLYYLSSNASLEVAFKALNNFENPLARRQGINLLGIIGVSELSPWLVNQARESAGNQFYAAQANYKITGADTEFNIQHIFPEDFELYGPGVYTAMGFLRPVILFISLNPERFTRIEDFDIGYIRPLPVYGKFGKTVSHSENIPLFKTYNDDEPLRQLKVNTPVLVLSRKGERVQVSGLKGASGWVPSGAVNIIENALEGTKLRFRNDYGFRWKKDLESIITHEYMKKARLDLTYTDPTSRFNGLLTRTMLDFAVKFSGQYSPPDFNGVMEKIDDNITKLKLKTRKPDKTYQINVNSTGGVEKILIIK
ncbi:MAG: HEAT repeat domain-containing protein [Vulcanimicrobiota bacterium]